MMTAMLCVENILADTKLYDLWQVNGDAEYHEAGDTPVEEAQGTAFTARSHPRRQHTRTRARRVARASRVLANASSRSRTFRRCISC